MSCDNIMQLYDDGTEIIVTVSKCTGEDAEGNEILTPIDISSATSMIIYLLKSDGTTLLTKTAAFASVASGATNDGTDGQMSCLSTGSEIDQTGGWRIQGWVQLPSGKWATGTAKFKVVDNLPGFPTP